jgi:CHAD domain-containing protein
VLPRDTEVVRGDDDLDAVLIRRFGAVRQWYTHRVRERETKLLVDSDFPVPPLDGLDGLQLESEDDVDLRAEYYDTGDLRLTRAGASLRYRTDAGWTVKLPLAAGTETALVRSEHDFGGAPGMPPAAALDLLRAFVLGEPVQPIAHVRTRRHRIVLTDRRGRPFAEIDDDRVVATAPSRPRCSFREVEIELTEDAPGKLGRRLTKRVRGAGPTTPSQLPKVARALGLTEMPPLGRGDARVPSDAPVTDLVAAVIDRSVWRLRVHDPVVRVGEDPEGVHQARVATRRLRSDLRMLRAELPRAWTESLRDELQWLGHQLGRVRDADVLRALLCAQSAWLSATRHNVLDEIVHVLDDQRARHRDELLRAMRSPRYDHLVGRLLEASHTPPVRDAVASDTASRVAVRAARKQWRRMQRAISSLGRQPDDPALHRARRRAKAARYAVESLAVVDRGWPEATAARAEALQDRLGEYQDRVVARAWLRDLARDRPDLAFVAGEIAGHLAVDQDAVRPHARRAWRAARKRKPASIRASRT